MIIVFHMIQHFSFLIDFLKPVTKNKKYAFLNDGFSHWISTLESDSMKTVCLIKSELFSGNCLSNYYPHIISAELIVSETYQSVMPSFLEYFLQTLDIQGIIYYSKFVM